MPDRKLTAVPLLFAAAALSACTVEAGATVSGDRLADAAADALEGEIGARPEVDCGDDDVIASDGKEVDCTMTDPASGEEYDAVVTFTGVEDDQWNIEVSVPDWQPEQAGQETQEAGDDAAEQGGSAGAIPAADIAAAAADALEAQVGSRPEIDCGEVDIVPEEGRTVYCTLIDAGAEYETTVTFTGVDGDQWGIDVQVASEPK
ncbi:MAG TPA: DUF4333 domain-containing protein [Glycomyces sp.]|nr:DUF4333 domain-containing protein [Glycomyces sp.]